MISSYDENNIAVKLLKEAVEVFANGEMFHDSLSRSAHMKGLQGFKRWHRVQSGDDRSHRVEIQHYVIDQFGENLTPEWNYEIKTPIDIENHLSMYLDWEIYVYKTVSVIGNRLMSEGFTEESNLVLKPLKGVRKEIEKIRRWILDFEFTNYDHTYIKMVDKILHDKIKKSENNRNIF